LERIADNKRKFDLTFQQITKHIDQIGQTNAAKLVEKELVKVRTQFIEIATITLSRIEILQNAIIFAKRQLIHPAVISTRLMRKYLFELRPPPTKMLPIQVNSDTSLKIIQTYTEVCQIETELVPNNTPAQEEESIPLQPLLQDRQHTRRSKRLSPHADD
jgi:hypothetical protein